MPLSDELTVYVIAWAALIGLVLGSFLNVVILRLPSIENILEEQEEPDLPKTLMGRSRCPACGEPIGWRHNIPVVSWLLLRGKSACCKTQIHWRYPVVEVATAASTALIIGILGLTPISAFAVLISCLLICLVVIDIDHMLLPDTLVYGVLWAALLASSIGLYGTPEKAIIGAVCGYMFVMTISSVFYALYKKEGIGPGDAKLMAAIGALSGGLATPGVMAGAMASFAFYAVITRRLNKDAKHPLGPFIIFGYVSWLIFGPYYSY